MKKKDKQSFVTMKTEELVKFISESKATIYTMVVQRFNKPMKNVREQKTLRKKIALAQTILHAKELTHE